MRKQTPLITFAACIATLSSIEIPTAQAKQKCSAAMPSNPHGYWSWRLIDGRKCWYEGKPMLSKSSLEWPAQASARPNSDRELSNRELSNSELQTSCQGSPAIHWIRRRGRRMTGYFRNAVACDPNDGLGVGFAGIVSKRRNCACGTGRCPHGNDQLCGDEETPKQCRECTMAAPVAGRIDSGSIRAITMAVFAIFMLSAGTAHAQFLFGPQYTFWPGHYAPFKHKHHHRQTNSGSAKSDSARGRSEGPAPDHHLDRRPTGLAF